MQGKLQEIFERSLKLPPPFIHAHGIVKPNKIPGYKNSIYITMGGMVYVTLYNVISPKVLSI
jgi:hypothetical protein